jgi:uncharacterized protein (DUF169 family)
MPDYRTLEREITEALGLKRRPVAVTFAHSAPSGVRKFSGTEPAGCSFWRLAEQGDVFYTDHGDHYNCAVGCFTHSIALPPERASELEQTLGTMIQVGYLRAEEVGKIAQLRRSPSFVTYAPLGDAPVPPDVVLFAGKPATIMLLNEAAVRAGVGAQSATLGRPTCMALPAALDAGVAVTTGCIGNRIYTDIGDDELYVAVRGTDLEHVVAEARTIAHANARLAEYHRARRKGLSTA